MPPGVIMLGHRGIAHEYDAAGGVRGKANVSKACKNEENSQIWWNEGGEEASREEGSIGEAGGNDTSPKAGSRGRSAEEGSDQTGFEEGNRHQASLDETSGFETSGFETTAEARDRENGGGEAEDGTKAIGARLDRDLGARHGSSSSCCRHAERLRGPLHRRHNASRVRP
jgi:hypothetical protein